MVNSCGEYNSFEEQLKLFFITARIRRMRKVSSLDTPGVGDTYLGQGEPTLDRGYLPWLVDGGGYLPWTGEGEYPQ